MTMSMFHLSPSRVNFRGVDVSWSLARRGRQRRVYQITDAGRDALRVALDAWMDATTALQDTGRAFAAADRARAYKSGC